MRVGERLTQDHFVLPTRRDQSALAQGKLVEKRLAVLGDGNEAADGGIREVRQVQNGVLGYARLNRLHARDICDASGEALRCALDAGKDVCEAITLVVRLRGLLERVERCQRHHQHADAGGDYQPDREHLALESPEVAHELEIQGTHQLLTRKARAPVGVRHWQ